MIIFQRLGTEKFYRVIDELLNGTSPVTLARRIQQEWGYLRDRDQGLLVMMLEELGASAASGELFDQMVAQAQRSRSQDPDLGVLSELVELAMIQRKRILLLRAFEKRLQRPVAALSKLIKVYLRVLGRIQKLRFDLGLDEYKGAGRRRPARLSAKDGCTPTRCADAARCRP